MTILLLNINVCGLAELQWERQGHFKTVDRNTTIYSGGKKQGGHGVVVWLQRNTAAALAGYEPISDRVLMINLNAKPRNITLIQVYAPTTAAEEHDVLGVYHSVMKAIKKTPKQNFLMMSGDFNAKVGKGADGVVGPYGIGEANEAGDRLRDFCGQQDMLLANTWFKHHPRWLYTWKSPNGKTD